VATTGTVVPILLDLPFCNEKLTIDAGLPPLRRTI